MDADEIKARNMQVLGLTEAEYARYEQYRWHTPVSQWPADLVAELHRLVDTGAYEYDTVDSLMSDAVKAHIKSHH